MMSAFLHAFLADQRQRFWRGAREGDDRRVADVVVLGGEAADEQRSLMLGAEGCEGVCTNRKANESAFVTLITTLIKPVSARNASGFSDLYQVPKSHFQEEPTDPRPVTPEVALPERRRSR
jgi:hypothetical protein